MHITPTTRLPKQVCNQVENHVLNCHNFYILSCSLIFNWSTANRYADLMQFFPRGRSALSEIFNYMVDHILREKGYILKNLNQLWLSRGRIERLCRSIARKGSPYNRCFGFVDGTIRANCRPTYNQREVQTRELNIGILK